ncbi:FAD-binding oxidoreductase [Croceicoccus bisphenolivorans]|uniref:FAD-binding oxidoreductase n=1 Tax=Croceicoccus bisphenolivorans TaxID=1783232 RepID=UPI00082AD63C|nr:FAD-binding oxidoreductase [Croceicoccus bisphenolivorans]
MRTPTGISPSVFTTALTAFAGVVGEDWVFTSDEDLDLYRDAYSPLRGDEDERTASAAVAPQSVEEVQAIVRIANEHSIPLYTISTGRNLGYGGSAPNYSGCVVLDLKRMNRIIEVSESNHYAIVEPGVSYFDLYNYIQEKGLKVWIDCPDPGWGSPIGNALDHGVGHTASRFRNHFDAHCGMEVVLANGEIMRTGMGALSGSNTWAQFKMGYGPVIDGMFSQSNFGIVTKMGFWLMPEPEAMLKGEVLATRYEDLHEMVELLKWAENSALCDGAPQLGSPLLGSPGDTKALVDIFYDGPPQLPPEQMKLIGEAKVGYSPELERYGIDNDLPYWKLYLSMYGPENVVQAKWEAIQTRAKARIKDVAFETGPLITDFKKAAAEHTVWAQDMGIPNLEFFALGARTPGNPVQMTGHLFFSAVVPQTADAILEANRVFDEASRSNPVLKDMPILGLRPFALPAGFHERTFLMIFGMPVVEDPAMNEQFIKAFRALIDIGAEHGWGEYRTAPLFQDQVMGIYDFNDGALLRFHETVKDAIDPKGILSPGRYGIWPRHLRKQS